MNTLNNYNIPNLCCIINENHKEELIYNLIMDKKVPFYKEEYGFNKDFFKLALNHNKSYIDTLQKNDLYDLHAFTRYLKDKSKIFDIINLDDKVKENNLIIKLIDFLDNNLNNAVIENICYVSNNKLLKNISDELSFLNISQTPNHSNNIIKTFLKSKFNIKKLNYYDINRASYKSKIIDLKYFFHNLKILMKYITYLKN